MDSATFQDDATVHGQSWPEVWEDSKKLLYQIVWAGVPSEPLQVLVFACMGKSARFGCWLAHVHIC